MSKSAMEYYATMLPLVKYIKLREQHLLPYMAALISAQGFVKTGTNVTHDDFLVILIGITLEL